VSEITIEENILKKTNQKCILDDLVIHSGNYNIEFFKNLDPMDLFSRLKGVKLDGIDGKSQGTTLIIANVLVFSIGGLEQREILVAKVEIALKNAEDEVDYMLMKQVEQEKNVKNQELVGEVFIGNIDDEDLGDDIKWGPLCISAI
jgi:E1A-binding protein p400